MADLKKDLIFYFVVIVLGGLTLGFATGFLSFPTGSDDSLVNLERTLTEGDLRLINEMIDKKLLEESNQIYRDINWKIGSHKQNCHSQWGMC